MSLVKLDHPVDLTVVTINLIRMMLRGVSIADLRR